MNRTLQLRHWLVLGASSAALLAGAPALAQTGGAAASTPSSTVGEIVVTAQRKSESLQSVPLAVSAFTQDSLKTQRLDGGQNLELSIPNVNYSRGNFGGYNFQIRGIGTKSVSPTGDPGVSFSVNELTVAANHLGDTDFYDVDRVEVLRGPVGTLYGRNATGGAVNVVYSQPTDLFGASITGDFGNFDSKKVTGFVNLPFGDSFAVRVAGFYLDRGGFGTNQYTGDKVDDRHLGSGRITLQWHPNDKFKSTFTYEHFAEDDHRNRVGKQLCTKDPGNAALASLSGPVAGFNQGLLGQGCLADGLYGPGSYGTLNSASTLGGILSGLIGLTSGDVYANNPMQNHNLHDINSSVDPIYKAEENLFIWKNTYNITDDLALTSLTGFNRNWGVSVEDYNRLVPTTPFNTTGPFAALFPGGFVQDPQVGTSNYFRTYDYGQVASREISEEIRLSSSFKGPLNFSIGGQYADDSTYKDDYDVMSNGLTAFAIANNALLGNVGVPAGTACTPATVNAFGNCHIIPIDGAATPASGQGHNYYDARFTVGLKSYSGFGEVYYQITPDIKLTGGIRYTNDHKTNVYYPIELLSATGAPGFGSNLTHQAATFTAVTGRFNVEWTPHLDFTNRTIVYAQYARGYQGGGFNTPCAAVSGCSVGATFAPVYVDAFEVGTKNTALNGRLTANLTGFYYIEDGYQVSTIVNKSSVNTNINAKLYGVEFEGAFQPIKDLTFTTNVGYLHTEITSGEELDQYNLTNGNPALQLVKASDGSNCVATTQGIATLMGAEGAGLAPSNALLGVCSGAFAGSGLGSLLYDSTVPNLAYGSGITTANGTPVIDPATNKQARVPLGVNQSLVGRQLPNSPEFTFSFGANYTVHLENWKITAHADYYWQDSSYARIFNDKADYLRSWDNANATLNFDRSDWGLTVQLYVKNIFDKSPITDAYLTDASSGLFQNVFTLDPRTYGIALTKKFD
ncbi:TonB-dependent receptor [Phenylobacterium montanum]|uniref:TonB-dependent receptor n=1 Tax=Phenylobacterium montanum TaxID=2823693 RepID=A0A975G2Q9_9CAUL|nr:TonB-dependent receptor [Caulobacter sp. S6]QUD90050.1 TonB-dependent receptor [Caulobacter sp. S6]